GWQPEGAAHTSAQFQLWRNPETNCRARARLVIPRSVYLSANSERKRKALKRSRAERNVASPPGSSMAPKVGARDAVPEYLRAEMQSCVQTERHPLPDRSLITFGGVMIGEHLRTIAVQHE